VFLNEASFQARCAAPRSGIDPSTGVAYPDIAGTITDENNFLRSWSNNTYLWFDEIVDRDPALSADPLAYFDQLRTTATTPSGAAKDKFHFTYDSAEWFQLSQSGESAGYGAEWAVLSATPPREIVVAYTEPGSPATDPAAALNRGTRVLAVDGFDVNTNTQAGVDALNAALFPDSSGETHSFTVQDVGATNSRGISMTSQIITNAMVQNTQVLDTPTGRVGYLLFNFHRAPAESELVAAINQLNAGPGVDDLVLDIRYNGGGFLAIASQLAYMIAGPGPTAGRNFETLQFNSKHPVTNPVTGAPISPTPFYDETLGFSETAGQQLPTLNLSRVFVLTGDGTCSASEAIMNGLRGADVEVVQIGSTTCGKPYGFYATDNCGTTYFTIQFRGVNDKNFGDYTDGFSPQNTVAGAGTTVPGCSVADDFDNALGDPLEARLATALNYRDGQACPAPSGTSPKTLSVTAAKGKALRNVPTRNASVFRSVWDSNRIVSTPGK